MRMSVNLKPEVAKLVEDLARELGFPRAKLVALLIRQELHRMEGREETAQLLKEVLPWPSR
jgi:hypothetical protein